MSTEFISIQAPPGSAIKRYNRQASASDQDADIPVHFCEAMSIREEVFVHEQNVPLANELDEDDARSWHWITYVSMGTSSAPAASASTTASRNDKSPDSHSRKGSTANRIAAATIRLVPPPHAPHPEPGTSHNIDAIEQTASSPNNSRPSTGADSHSTNNPESEPYIKLGRAATLQPFRKLGLARLLVETALDWAAAHSDEILPPPSATAREAARAETGDDDEWVKEWEKKRWRGLVLVHAQTSVMEWWKKRGFVVDEGLGEWVEEGIKHCGMWKRIALKDRRG